MRALVALVALAGCDGIFDLVEVDGVSGGDASTDAPGVSCATTQLKDTFDDATKAACSWGGAFGTVTQSDGALHVTLDGNPGAGGCSSTAGYRLTAGGIVLNVTKHLSVASSYTTLKVRSRDTSDFSVALSLEGDNLIAYNGVTAMNVAAASNGWLRLRNPSGEQISAETSSDGLTWRPVAEFSAGAVPSAVNVDILAGLNAASAPGVASFAELAICD